LTSAKATLESPYGKILCSWNHSEGATEIDVEIPVNTTAKIVLKNMSKEKLIINNLSPKELESLKIIETPDGLVCQVGSGSYSFQHEAEVLTFK
jgi:alpha-L-rhamnosidase